MEKRGSPPIGIDIDGTIDEDIPFFQILTQFWPGPVHIITHRLSTDGAKQQLHNWGIRYTSLNLCDSAETKFEVMKALGVEVMFDDSDDVICNTPDSITVFKMRHADNFDFTDKRWWHQSHTSKPIDGT